MELLSSWGEKPYRARQLWSWLYRHQTPDIMAMTEFSKDFRTRLAERCGPLRPKAISHVISEDTTEKWALSLEDEQIIETVFIPEKDRGTLCLSTQAGCTLSCAFCYTGTQNLARNLTTFEIIEQLLFASTVLADRNKRITNVVFMGMGEPLYNYDAVAKAIRILMDANGLAFGCRKITLSTAGVVPHLTRIGCELGVNLAISLHSVRDSVRNRLVPLNRKYNLAALRQAVLDYPLKRGRRITWEYVMLRDINDRREDADDLIQYLENIPSKINLIPFNPWSGTDFEPSSAERIDAFQERLRQRSGIVTVVRTARGADIDAACGQLKGTTASINESVSGRNFSFPASDRV